MSSILGMRSYCDVFYYFLVASVVTYHWFEKEHLYIYFFNTVIFKTIFHIYLTFIFILGRQNKLDERQLARIRIRL